MLKKVLKSKVFIAIMVVLVIVESVFCIGAYRKAESVKFENWVLQTELKKAKSEKSSYLDQITSLESYLRDVKVELEEMEKKESEGNFIKRLFNK